VDNFILGTHDAQQNESKGRKPSVKAVKFHEDLCEFLPDNVETSSLLDGVSERNQGAAHAKKLLGKITKDVGNNTHLPPSV
jgi:hypothetical protein